MRAASQFQHSSGPRSDAGHTASPTETKRDGPHCDMVSAACVDVVLAVAVAVDPRCRHRLSIHQQLHQRQRGGGAALAAAALEGARAGGGGPPGRYSDTQANGVNVCRVFERRTACVCRLQAKRRGKNCTIASLSVKLRDLFLTMPRAAPVCCALCGLLRLWGGAVVWRAVLWRGECRVS
jgi:hypothetical protein